MTRARPRSALFVPGSNARAIDKARSLGADAVIFDLEDSVHDDQRPLARRQVADAIATGGYGDSLLLVRVPALDGPDGLSELDAACAAGAGGVVLPKVESEATILQAQDALDRAGSTAEIWAMIETPLGLLNCAAIAATRRKTALTGLMIGPNDLLRTTGVTAGPGRINLLPWLMQMVLAGKAYDLTLLDGVYNNFADEAGFAAECAQAQALGFDGKALIHPRQVEPTHLAFRPSPERIAWAEKVQNAFINMAVNVAQVDGEMVERLHLEVADAILARAR